MITQLTNNVEHGRTGHVALSCAHAFMGHWISLASNGPVMSHITYVALAKPRSLAEQNACMLTSKAARLITRCSNVQLLFLNLHSLDATTVTFKLTKECATYWWTAFVPKQFPTHQVAHETRMLQTGPVLPFDDKAGPKAHSVCSWTCKCPGNATCCTGLHDVICWWLTRSDAMWSSAQ